MEADDDALNGRWTCEQASLGLDRNAPDEAFARGGLASFAVDPTVRIVVLPGNPSSQPVPADNPESVIPKVMAGGGRQFPYHWIVRGTSSGYVRYTTANEGRRQSFAAAQWHGGVDVFPGVLHHVLRYLIGRRKPRNVLGGPVDADDVPAGVRHVESKCNPRVVADVAQLDLRCLAGAGGLELGVHYPPEVEISAA